MIKKNYKNYYNGRYSLGQLKGKDVEETFQLLRDKSPHLGAKGTPIYLSMPLLSCDSTLISDM